MVVALTGALALGTGLAACGSGTGATDRTGVTSAGAASDTASTHATDPATDTTGESSSTVTSSTMTAPSAGSGSAATSTTETTTTTSSSGGGSAASGGAGLSPTTSTTTTAACGGHDCENGSPTVPGSVPPVDGHCGPGYVYLGPQDGGPALCIPQSPSGSTATGTATQ